MAVMAEALSASLENYLEAIFLLVRDKTVARSKDISERLHVNRSSVTGALQTLSERGLVNYEPYGFVTLTGDGSRAARKVLRRHEALREFFVRVLAIDAEEADEAACRMEHGVSKNIVDRLIDFAEFVEVCPRAGVRWVQGFESNCRDAGGSVETCERCIERCLRDVRKHAVPKGTKAMSTGLDALKRGEKGRIEKVLGSGAVKRRIRDMGVTPGSVVEVVRIAPMGDPIDVKVKGYHLSLRKEEAADIRVSKV